MHRRKFNRISLSAAGSAMTIGKVPSVFKKEMSIGVIGLDTSHSTAFAKIINEGKLSSLNAPSFKVTHAFPQGSKDIESSVRRIPKYTEEMLTLGVKIVPSIAAMLDEVDAVLLETNDGRLHLEQAIEVFEKGKITFIDKPIAASLKDVIQIFAQADKYQVPVFSASSLRYAPSTQEIAQGNKIGQIIGANTYSPATIEKTHPDLFWYGIHGVESLFTLMGPGCTVVQRVHHQDVDVVTGLWQDGRIGTFRGLRNGKTGYGGTAFGTEGIAEAGKYEGYEPLVKVILEFFQTGIMPISPEETIEIFAFMEAAEESKRRNGARVKIAEMMEAAQE